MDDDIAWDEGTGNTQALAKMNFVKDIIQPKNICSNLRWLKKSK
jgi:hypothetical protein